jgi:hypothetical protein
VRDLTPKIEFANAVGIVNRTMFVGGEVDGGRNLRLRADASGEEKERRN